jgi:hypothetical protein
MTQEQAANIRALERKAEEREAAARRLVPRPGQKPERLGRNRRRQVLITIWLLLAAFLVVRQLQRETLTLLPDELFFAKLAQNLADAQGFSYRGASSPYKTLYPFLISPIWALFGTATAYHVTLGLNAAVMTATFFPAYVIARRITSFWWAVAAAFGTVVVPAMVLAGMVMTEPFAYPLAAFALLAMVEALRKPGWRSATLVGAAIAAAVAVRAQMWFLVPTFALAIGLDILRFAGSDWTARIRAHSWALGGLGLMLAVGLGALATESLRGILGSYADTAEDLPNLARLAEFGVDYVGVLIVASLGLPVIATVTLAVHRSSWCDRELAAVLAVAVSALVMMIIQAAWFSATISPELRERYVFYATPVLAACWVALWERRHWKTIAAVTALLSVYTLLLFPGFSAVTEGWIEHNLAHVVDRVLGVRLPWLEPFGLEEQLAIVVALLGVLAAVSTRIRGGAGAVALLLPTMAFGFLVLNLRQTEANRQSQIERGFIPSRADLIDRLSDGPAALVATGGTEPFRIWDLEFWNRDLDQVFVLDSRRYAGHAACPLAVASDGSLAPVASCSSRRLPRHLVFADARVHVSVDDARLRYRDRDGRRLFELPPGGRARVRSLVYGCATRPVLRCQNPVTLKTWSRTGGSAVLVLRARAPVAYQVGRRSFAFTRDQGRRQTIRVRFPRGYNAMRIVRRTRGTAGGRHRGVFELLRSELKPAARAAAP